MPIDFNPQVYMKPMQSQSVQNQYIWQKLGIDTFQKSKEADNNIKTTQYNGIKITKKDFGTLQKSNQKTYLYTITNKNGASVDISNFGATITSIKIPDKNGKLTDVVQGYDNVTPYELSPIGHAGGTIGPVANKISGAKFTLGNRIYELEANKDNHTTHCHGGSDGFDVKLWDAKELSDGIEFSYLKKDMENGYPGNILVKVTYKFDNDNKLHINYQATTDKDTLINMTNHTYFNLDGSENTKENSIYEHVVTLPNSKSITENNEISIPTGKIMDVKNTPFDFSKPRKIGEVINNNSDQLKIGGGFDHNFIIENYDGKTLIEAANIKSPKTGIGVSVLTNLPGFQFYSANHLGKKEQPMGKTGTRYEKRSALCVEPQFFPNAINTPEFKEKGILKKGELYNRDIIYSFKID